MLIKNVRIENAEIPVDIRIEDGKFQTIREGLTPAEGEEVIDGGGHLLLDGTQATTYARIRSTAGGDFTRTERQRIVLEKMFEKAKSADLVTLNEIINQIFPQVSTSFTLQEIITYASAYSEYTLGENRGFPFENYTDTLSEIGSVVIPDDLVSNVTQLHDFLFGTTGYTPSSTVQTVNSNIIYTANSAGYSYTETYDDGSSYYDESSYYDDGSGYYDDTSGYYDDGSGSYYDDGSGSYTDDGTYDDGNASYDDGGGGVYDDGSGSGGDGYTQDNTGTGAEG